MPLWAVALGAVALLLLVPSKVLSAKPTLKSKSAVSSSKEKTIGHKTGKKWRSPPDLSHGYFPGLKRPAATQVDIKREGGPVIMIIVDALRPDHMTPYGYKRNTTPHLNELADEGVILTNFFVNGNWTRPSTTTMLTGLPPIEHGVEHEGDRLAAQYVTFAEVLSYAKIPTGAVVGNGNAGSAFGLSQGFDFYADTVKHWQGLPSGDQVMELALPFVHKHKADPFFLMLFFVDPHDPYHAPGDFEDMFVEEQYKSAKLIRTPHWELGRYSPAELERMKATYDGALRYTDSVMGRFFDVLRREGIYDKATIIVTSDHGEAFGEHGVYLHAHHFYDEIVRVPMIIKAPKMSQRGVYNHYLFQGIDLFPSILSYYGIAQPPQNKHPLKGVDIFAHLSNSSLNDPQRTVISSFNNFGIRRRMLRTYTQKLIYQAPADETEFLATVGKRSYLPSVKFDSDQLQLFDLTNDPWEKKDLFGKSIKAGKNNAALLNRIKKPRWRQLIKILRAHKELQREHPREVLADHIDPETYADLRALGYIQ